MVIDGLCVWNEIKATNNKYKRIEQKILEAYDIWP